MAEIGHALMAALTACNDHPALKDWAPINCPSEIVGDLLNALDEATRDEPPIIHLNGHQLLEALDFIAPDHTAEQLETELCIQHGPSRTDDDGEVEGPGYYCWYTEYPEEGAIFLATERAGGNARLAALTDRDAILRWARFADTASRMGEQDMRNNLIDLAEWLSNL